MSNVVKIVMQKKCQMRQLLAYRLTNEYSDTNLKDLQQIHFTSMILEK